MERRHQSTADRFYVEVLKATEIKRFNTDSEADMEMQRQDVDLLLTLNNVTYRISEKFREKDYGDLYVEVFSKYPAKEGWLFSGSPHAVLYFTPERVLWITHKSLSEFCKNNLFPFIPNEWYEELVQSHQSILSKNLKISDATFTINLIQAHNEEGSSWETIGISAPLWVFQENGVKIMLFKPI